MEESLDYEKYFQEPDENFYNELDILDFKFNKDTQAFTYPCPCGDLFTIYLEDIVANECIARCPSCSLIVKVIYEEKDIIKILSELEEEETILLTN